MKQDYLLHKYLNGQASAAEIEALRKSEEYAELLDIAKASSGFELPEFDRERNYEAILQKRRPQLYRRSKKLRYLSQIAAVVIILLAGLLFLNNRDELLTTDRAEQLSFTLPDGSQVRLNAQSQIRYSEKNWKRKRELSLSGEAFFEVEKGEKFEVSTQNGIVSVLGTRFNVMARDSILDVVCYEGLVQVEASGKTIRIAGGKKIRITGGRWGTLTETSQPVPGWLTGESSFNNASLRFVLSELQHYYEVAIDLEGPNLDRMSFTGNFPHDDLEIALRSICDPLKLRYEINDKQVRIYAP